MGKKRHHKGANNAQDRKRRKEAEEKWKSVRHDEQQVDHRDISDNWNNEPFENKRFDAFYEAQHFLNGDEDVQAFRESLVKTLPACFRLYTDNPFIDNLRNELVGFIEKYHSLQQQKQSEDAITSEGGCNNEQSEKLPLEQMAWYPNGSGYKLSLDRRSIRKRPELADLHQWMVQHTENGNITRQEAVSMVPPIALDVQPHHKCLDLCAAPGSKTSQLLETINRSLDQSEKGLVVANDSDTDRAYMLVHQCRRINSPLLVVTTHQGQAFPSIVSNPQIFQEMNQKAGLEFFDRVLCDVPCSGDGTLRKNPAIWPKWNTAMGAVMHPLQLMIAKRGLQVLKKGGLMVYSTCSMSPYENESVVAELLRANRGKLELVDARQFLPLFKARRGLSTWNVLDDHFLMKKELQAKREQKMAKSKPSSSEGIGESEMVIAEKEEKQSEQTLAQPGGEEQSADFSHISDVALRRCLEMGMQLYPSFEEVPNSLKWKYRQTLFPPSAEEAEWMHLERCLRCVPHDEDTGGFFVATLRKVDSAASTAATTGAATAANSENEIKEETAAISEEEAKAREEVLALDAEGGENVIVTEEAEAEERDEKKSRGRKGKKEEANGGNGMMVKYHVWDEASFQQMKDYYQFDETVTSNCFYVREDLALQRGKAAATAPTIAKTIYYFPPVVQSLLKGDINQQLKVVTAGVKAFDKKASGAGVASSVPVDYRLLQDCLPFLRSAIHARKVAVTCQDFSNLLEGGLVSYSTLSPQTLQQLGGLSIGTIICEYLYSVADVLPSTETETETGTPSPQPPIKSEHTFSLVCWRGSSACLNVMCNRIDLQTFKHQLKALNVLRPKISPVSRAAPPSATEAEETAVAESEAVVDEVV